jgi:hypothetical protein
MRESVGGRKHDPEREWPVGEGGPAVSSADGWNLLAAVRLPNGLAPDQVVLSARRRAQASVKGQLQKGVYCVYLG